MDLDSGPNGEIVYEIIDGDKRTFYIDSKTGEISLKQTLTSTKYDLIVEAKDRGMSVFYFLYISKKLLI